MKNIDDSKITEDVKSINEIYEGGTTEMALKIGKLVFENYFDSDPEAVASKDPKKKTSFNKLCEHEDLGLERSQLSRMVNVHIQEEILKKEKVKFDKLTYSHRVELLKIKGEKEKIEMAKKCVEESLSIRALRKEISPSTSKKAAKVDLKINSKTLSWFSTSEAAIMKIDALIEEPDIKNIKNGTRKKLHENATSLLEHLKNTTDKLTKLIEELDDVPKKK